MNVRAKFMLTEHRHEARAPDPAQHGHVFVFKPQYDPNIPEDQRFAKASPTGELNIRVDNPAVVDEWMKCMGQQFYIDFTAVPAVA